MGNDNHFITKREISSEKLAYWYLRLNGFLSITNFVVHPDVGRNQRTDVDILGCRFPFRQELLENSMIDDKALIMSESKPTIVIAEVKRNTCNLNGPWTDPEKKNMERVLNAIGAFPEEENNKVASALYEFGFYENDFNLITLMCFGEQKNLELLKKYPKVKQILWNNVLRFIYNRFKQYWMQKSMHPQWDIDGELLWHTAANSSNVIDFIKRFKIK